MADGTEASPAKQLETILRLDQSRFENEADVREGLLTPIFDLLGYAKGTPHDIEREPSIPSEYAPSPKRPDYVLSVAGTRMIVVEVKASMSDEYSAAKQGLMYAAELDLPLLLIAGRERIRLIRTDRPPVTVLTARVGDLRTSWPKVRQALSPSSVLPSLVQGMLGRDFDAPPTERIALDVKQAEEARSFFKGYSDSWVPIQAGLAIDVELVEADDEFNASELPGRLTEAPSFQFLKLFGPGGSGKTTLLRKLAYRLARAGEVVLLRAPMQLSVDRRLLAQAVQLLGSQGKRLFLLYDGPVSQGQTQEVLAVARELQAAANVRVVVAEREDEWLAGARANDIALRGESVARIRERLSAGGMEALCAIIQRLQDRGIQVLTGDRSAQDFKGALTDTENILLVAVYEAATGDKIEATLRHEFDNIPGEEARKLYDFICGLTRYGLQIPATLAIALFGRSSRKELREHLMGIVYERRGQLLARHRTVCEILWRIRYCSPDEELETLLGLVDELGNSRIAPTQLGLRRFSRDLLALFLGGEPVFEVGADDLLYQVEVLTAFDPERESFNYLRVGRLLAQRGEFGPAAKILRKAVNKRPDTAIYMALASALSEGGLPDDAVATLREATENAPSEHTFGALATELIALGRIDEAIQVLTDATESAPGDHLYVALASAIRKSGDLAGAIATLRDALKQAPTELLYTALASALRDAGQPHEAVEVLRQAVNESPGEHLNLVLASALREAGEPEAAIEVLREALDRTRTEDLFVALASALRDSGKLDEATRVLREGAEETPGEQVLGALASALSDSGKIDEAIELLREAVKEVKTHSLHIALGNTLRHAGRAGEAIGVLRQAVDEMPGSAHVYVALAQALTEEGRTDEAIDLLRRQIKGTPSEYIYGFLASMLRDSGESEEAIQVLQEGTSRVPTHRICALLGSALLENGHEQEAFVAFREAAHRRERGSRQAEASFHYLVGTTHNRIGNLDSATSHLERALDIRRDLDDRRGAEHITRLLQTIQQAREAALHASRPEGNEPMGVDE